MLVIIGFIIVTGSVLGGFIMAGGHPVHLIQVSERRQVELSDKEIREQARAALREQKFESAYLEWAKELRARAYIEMREPPQ